MEQKRQMGLAAAVAVVTGESIALGIFLTPAAMAKSLGSPALLAAVWCGMAAMALAGALCYSELAVRYPLAGGEYVYLREGYGPRVAFLYGWMSAAVIDPGIAAALAFGAIPYVQAIFAISPRTAALLPFAILAVLGAINYLGTRLSGRVMATANLLKLAVLFGLVAWAFMSGHASTANLLPLTTRRPGSDMLFGAIAGSVVNAFFSFGGWWEAGKLAGEIRNPRRTLPLAFTCGVLLVSAIYLLVSFAFLAVVPLDKIVSNTAFVAQFGQALFGSAGGKILSACVLLSVTGGLMALTMAAPRVYYAMAKDGAFFSVFARLASALWNARQRGVAANLRRAADPSLRRLRQNSRLHHLFGSLLSRAFRHNALPCQRSRSPLVVPCGSHCLSRRQCHRRAAHPDAQPIAGTHRRRCRSCRRPAAEVFRASPTFTGCRDAGDRIFAPLIP